jgi:hypothetical protein
MYALASPRSTSIPLNEVLSFHREIIFPAQSVRVYSFKFQVINRFLNFFFCHLDHNNNIRIFVRIASRTIWIKPNKLFVNHVQYYWEGATFLKSCIPAISLTFHNFSLYLA